MVAHSVVLAHLGTPKIAITASPMNFSTVPPCRAPMLFTGYHVFDG